MIELLEASPLFQFGMGIAFAVCVLLLANFVFDKILDIGNN